jgi:hypothetical protein
MKAALAWSPRSRANVAVQIRPAMTTARVDGENPLLSSHRSSDGRYRLRVRVEPPSFSRHDKTNGYRYLDAVEVEFENVEVKTGRK